MKKIERQVENYLEYCEKVRRMTEATLAQKRNVLMRFVRVTRISCLGELDNEVMNRWVEYSVGGSGDVGSVSGMRGGASARSVNMYNAVVVAMVRYYRGVGVEVPVNLSLVGKLKEGAVRRRFYTADEVGMVVARTDLETGLIIRIMFETGMRIAEVCRLRVADFDGRRVRFVGKGRKPREVYVTLATLEGVREYVGLYGISGYLWSVWGGIKTCNGEPPTVNTVRSRLRRVFAEAGFPDFYPHSLRHSFATDLQMRGASVAEIKEMIGHENIATTERYLHGFEGRMRELFDKYR